MASFEIINTPAISVKLNADELMYLYAAVLHVDTEDDDRIDSAIFDALVDAMAELNIDDSAYTAEQHILIRKR